MLWGMGRPSKLTPERQKAICGFIAAGVPNVNAAQLSGICEATFYHWLKLAEPGEDGEDPDPRYLEFSECVKDAESGFIASGVELIRRAATDPTVTKKEHVREDADGKITKEIVKETRPPTWQPMAWLLERRRPELFGRRLEHAGEVKLGPPTTVEVVFTPEEEETDGKGDEAKT